jgi:hypothetical protein
MTRLPDSVGRGAGFNFQTKVEVAKDFEILGTVMPKGHYGAFPKPAADTIFMRELRGDLPPELQADVPYLATNGYVVVGDPSKSTYLRIWDRETFDAAKMKNFSIAPELIASCQRYESFGHRVVCWRAIRLENNDIGFDFRYEDLKALQVIERAVKEQIVSWQCSR